MRITTFDRRTARELGPRIEAALAALAAETGLTFTAVAKSLSDRDVTLTLTASLPTTGADAEAREAEAKALFEALAPRVGLEPGDYRKSVRIGRDTYTITGISLSAPKYPVQASRSDGKGFRLPVGDVLRSLGRPVVPTLTGF